MLALIRNVGNSVQGVLQRSPSTKLRLELSRHAGVGLVNSVALGVGHLFAAAVCRELLERGESGWLHLLVVFFVWNGLKFWWQGVFGAARLMGEHVGRRLGRR